MILEYRGIRYAIHPQVYAPHDDSWLLADAVLDGPPLGRQVVAEVGCGVGLALVAALQRGARGVGTDLNPFALRLARSNMRLNGFRHRALFLEADLVSAFDVSKVDLLLFNPPYLPTGPDDRVSGPLHLAFDGGLSGNDVALQFADALRRHHAAGGRVPPVLMMLSSLNDEAGIAARMAAAGLAHVTELAVRRVPHETLTVRRYASSQQSGTSKSISHPRSSGTVTEIE